MTGNNMNQEALIPNPEDRIMCVKVGKPKIRKQSQWQSQLQ